jgi:hypothetical protein
MHPTKVAAALRAQIHHFSGIFSPRFSKPQSKFIEQTLFGIAAAQDCKLSQISRAPGEPMTLKKTEERLSRHLAIPELDHAVHEPLLAHAARKIHRDTLLVVAPTDIRQPFRQSDATFGNGARRFQRRVGQRLLGVRGAGV